MNRKKIFLFLLLMICVSSTISASNEIELRSIFQNTTNGKRVPAAPAVEATQTGDFIRIFFLNNVGNVAITITTETGETVYNHTVSTDYGVSEIIDTQNFTKGDYFITITNNSGMWLQGEFEI